MKGAILRSASLLWVATIATLTPSGVAAVGSQDAGRTALAVVSGAAFVAVGIYDIATARSSARRHNEMALGVTPWVDATGQRVGVALTIAFPDPGFALPRRRAIESAPKSPTTALLWSLGATLTPSAIGLGMSTASGWRDTEDATFVGIVMVGTGWLVGPSAGHWYAGRGGRGLATLGLRFGIGALGMLAAAEHFATSP